jgi:hypothetical protein
MKRALQLFLVVCLAVLSPPSSQAKPKKKTYNNSADQLFLAAVRTARDRHVVTYVDEKMLMFTFETGRSFSSNGFVANASVEANGPNRATLTINVQNKQGVSFGAGDRMADKFYEQVDDELAGESKQPASVRPTESAIATVPPKNIPETPSFTKPTSSTSAAHDVGKIMLTSSPNGADVYVDDGFIGNTPATLRLPDGKHTVRVSQDGYVTWSRELSVYAGSEVNMNATLQKK